MAGTDSNLVSRKPVPGIYRNPPGVCGHPTCGYVQCAHQIPGQGITGTRRGYPRREYAALIVLIMLPAAFTAV